MSIGIKGDGKCYFNG
jgi:hypothetical protein